jgi:phosphatidate cytidylyltransferase
LRTLPEWRGIAQPGVILVLLLVSFIRQIHSTQTEKPLITIAGTMLGFLYVAFLFNFFTSILGSWNKTDGRLLLFFMLLVTKFTDIGAYSIGCAIGRHKFMPRISPAKSWEGCIGGVLTATVVGFIYYFFVRRYFVCVSMTWIDVAVLGPVLAVCGIMGDLTESLFKRAADMKDSGTSIRGMGGILDVFDSLLFAAPVLYYYAFMFMR